MPDSILHISALLEDIHSSCVHLYAILIAPGLDIITPGKSEGIISFSNAIAKAFTWQLSISAAHNFSHRNVNLAISGIHPTSIHNMPP